MEASEAGDLVDEARGAAGLTIDAQQGAVSWVPQAAGRSQVIIAAVNGFGRMSAGSKWRWWRGRQGAAGVMSIVPDEGVMPLRVELDGGEPGGRGAFAGKLPLDAGDGSAWAFGELAEHVYSLPGGYSVELLVRRARRSGRAQGSVAVYRQDQVRPPLTRS